MKPLTRALRRARGHLTTDDLRAAGVTLGWPVNIQRGVFVDLTWGWLITLGSEVTLGPGAMVLAHDASTRRALGYTRVAPVTIEDRVFVGARAVVLPGVTIGEGAVIGAGAVVARDVPAGVVAVGAPARPVADVDEFLERREKAKAGGLVLDDLGPDGGRSFAAAVRDAGEAWVR